MTLGTQMETQVAVATCMPCKVTLRDHPCSPRPGGCFPPRTHRLGPACESLTRPLPPIHPKRAPQHLGQKPRPL